MKKPPRTQKRKEIYIFVFIFSLILYLAGVFSGLHANKIFVKHTDRSLNELETKTNESLESLKESFEGIKGLENYVNFLGDNIGSLQFEQTFMETLAIKDRCRFSEISVNALVGQLRFYWENLPARIEDYATSEEERAYYLRLQKEYTDLSIRTWILSRNQERICNSGFVTGLFFYSHNCEACMKQGEELEKLKEDIRAKGTEMIVFGIDANTDDTLVQHLMEYYNITTTPALIISDRVFADRVYTAEEMRTLTFDWKEPRRQ